MQILFYILLAFLGYTIGRLGHIYLGGQYKGFHHWIYGAGFVFVGYYSFKDFQLPLAYFGTGVFVSDLNDFLHLKFYGIDPKGKKRFWAVD